MGTDHCAVADCTELAEGVDGLCNVHRHRKARRDASGRSTPIAAPLAERPGSYPERLVLGILHVANLDDAPEKDNALRAALQRVERIVLSQHCVQCRGCSRRTVRTSRRG
jgi:hypothetical protein